MPHQLSTGRIIGIVVLALFGLSLVIGGSLTLASMSAVDQVASGGTRPSNTVLGTLGAVQVLVALASFGMIYWMVKSAPLRMSPRQLSERMASSMDKFTKAMSE